MNIGCAIIHNTQELIIFGGVNALGETSNIGLVIKIDNEDKGTHSYTNQQVTLEEGDAFPNTGCFYR